MAQYRLSLSIASRGKGRSAVAMAAYRAGDEIRDERTGERFDFTRKQGILHTEMVLPPAAPEWAHNRAEFWNRSEAADKRQDAQIAREIQLSLPHELSDRERRDLTTGFAQEVAGRFGIAVDTCIHAPNYAGDERNHHAHLMLATRPFDEEKASGFGNKLRVLDNIARQRQGPKEGPGQSQENEVEKLRAEWARRLNEALQRAEVRSDEGALVQLDHRSYERQGIDREPTVKEGPAATGLKRRGEASERVEINEEIRARNERRDRLKEHGGSVAREVERLKKSSQGRDAETEEKEVSAHFMAKMTEEELRAAARIDDFRARFEIYKADCCKADEQQTIERDYDMNFAKTGDPLERYEKEQRIDDHFEEDMKQLEIQNDRHKIGIEDWLQGERERMRAEDAARNPRQPAQQYVPGFAQIPGFAQSRDVAQPDPNFRDKEALRSSEADEMRKEFRDFQQQRHVERRDKTEDRYHENLDLVAKSYERETTRQELDQSLTQTRQAANRTHDDLKRELTPPQEPKPEQEQDNIRLKKGETLEQARERVERMKKAEEERKLSPTRKEDRDFGR